MSGSSYSQNFCGSSPTVSVSQRIETCAKNFDVVLSSTIIHLSTPQSSPEEAYAALLANSNNSQLLSANEHAPIMVHIYPSVPSGPPFPFRSKPPALVQAGESNSVDPYIRSAMNLSYSRTLALLRRELGPHFNLEKLWEKHTYYVRAFTFLEKPGSQPT